MALCSVSYIGVIRVRDFLTRRKELAIAARAAARRLKRSVSDVASHAERGLDAAIREHRVDERIAETREKIADKLTEFGVGDAADKGQRELRRISAEARALARGVDEHLGLTDKVETGRSVFVEAVMEPVQARVAESQASQHVRQFSNFLEASYGRARASIVPPPEVDDAEQLLRETRLQLVRITSTVLQVPEDQADAWLGRFGRVLTSKVSGVLGSGTLLGLVSAFGTAGTGTAIASLSGAASTSATLAWIGGLLGGGMAVGAVLTAGVGLAVGVGAYKLLGAKARQFNELADVDRGVVETAGALVAAIDEQLDSESVELRCRDASALLRQTLIPFCDELKSSANDVSSRLSGPNAIAYRQHVVPDFESVVIEGFRKFAMRPELRAEAVISGTLYALLAGGEFEPNDEQVMVLDALRRSTTELGDATTPALGDYINEQGPEQLRGIASNVKGIYHELWWVEQYNVGHEDTFARVMGATNHPGVDVEIVNEGTGAVLESYQLKATDNLSLLREHHAKYPDIDVFATSEVATRMSGVQSSGASNADLEYVTLSTFDEMVDADEPVDTIVGAAVTGGLAAAGREAILVMRGERQVSGAVKTALDSSIQAAGAAGVTAFLFG
jgi:hypothetical protein